MIIAPVRNGLVGVDVVDPLDPRCVGKGVDERFLRRVLGDEERAAVAVAAHPDAALWRLWAAKEAAFKVVSKLCGSPPPFVHPAFRVHPAAAGSAEGGGIVTWRELSVHIRWHEQSDQLAALGWDRPAVPERIDWGWGTVGELDPVPNKPLDALLERLGEGERDAVHSRASALVRLAARTALATALDIAEDRITLICAEGPRGRTPPVVYVDGLPVPVDLSLSHHGRWLAWAIRLSRPRPPGTVDPD